MTNLSQLRKYYSTNDATVAAKDIVTGKIAYGSAGQIIGAQNRNKILVAWDFQGATGVYLPNAAECALIHPNMTISGLGNFDRTAAGVVGNTTGTGITFGSAPVRTTARHWIFTLDLAHGAHPDGLFDCQINYASGTNHVICRIIHNVGGWQLDCYSVIAGVTTLQGSVNIDAAIEEAYGIFTITDYGDTVLIGGVFYEKGSTNVVDGTHLVYYAAGRANKNTTDFRIDWEQAKAVRLQQLLLLDY